MTEFDAVAAFEGCVQAGDGVGHGSSSSGGGVDQKGPKPDH